MREARLILVLCAMLLAALPAAAGARVLRSESILPPGQSGFVSIPGVTKGTGSPHLYDQVRPFIRFQRKDDRLDPPGTPESVPHAGVKIRRDRFGVPDIHGTSDQNAWWGAGYAIAQDRLFQLDLFRRSTEGHLAEILGKSYIPSDVEARRDYYTTAELDRMYGALPVFLRRRILAYRDGINAWIRHVTVDAADLPGEFPATGDLPIRPWTKEDTLAIGVVLARTIPTGDGDELTNVRALRELGPTGFAHLIPLRVPGQVTTIPRSEGAFPSQPGRTAAQEASGYRRSRRFVAHLPLPAVSAAAHSSRSLPATLIDHLGGSYMFAVHRSGGRRAYLFNGPELGFTVPEELVELEVHAPGLAVRGVTAPGVPIVGIGHNAHVAWGLTSGLSDTNDLYADRTLPGRPEAYRFRGRVRHMSCRDERFVYRSPPTDVLGGSLPGAGIERRRLCRDVHGPVQERVGNVAYARRYATFEREIPTIVGLAAVNRARNIHEVDRAVAKVTWDENLMAVDDRGHIGFWHPGLLPLRPRRYDERLPYPGDGSAEWRGFLPVGQRPHVIDPRQGWLSNWNNVPSAGWTSGDGGADHQRLDGRYHRDGWLARLVSGLVRSPSYDASRGAVRRAGTIAQQRPLAAAPLRRALQGARRGSHAATVLRTILAWSGSYTRTDSHGTVNPGVATFQAFELAAERRALRNVGGGHAPGPATVALAGAVSNSHMFDASLGEAFALRTLSPVGYRAAATHAYDVLAQRFGTRDPSRWREPRRQYPVAAQGAGSPPKLPFFDRGTWEQLVELTAVPSRAPRPAHHPRFTG